MSVGEPTSWSHRCARKTLMLRGVTYLVAQRCRSSFVDLLLLMVLAMSLGGMAGCQFSLPFDRSAPLLDHAHFMDAWHSYLHCRSSVEPDEIRIDLDQLHRVAQTIALQNQVSPLVPAGIRPLIAAPLIRLSVDPHEMVLSCALHGSRVAQSAGRPEVAVELFRTVLASEGAADSAFLAPAIARKVRHLESAREADRE